MLVIGMIPCCATVPSERLRDTIAALARRLANSIAPWSDIHVLVPNRLIVLDKCPGVRPIGIGKSLRRVVGKATCFATCLDLVVLCGTDQLCGRIMQIRY